MADIIIREATLDDVPAVRKLAIDSVTFSIPHTRDVDPKTVRERTRQGLEKLELTLHRPDFKTLVAIDTDAARLAGYIMLNMQHHEASTGETQCFIQDLAVRQDYWSHGVGHSLVRAAAEAAAVRGLKYLVADVTVRNERSLRPATQSLGFEIEREQICKRLV